MDTKNLICIECPRGCEMTISIEGNKVNEVKGNFCVRGKNYAINELICPVRTVTSTIRLSSGEMLPVKTNKGVAKTKIFDVMKKINATTANKPIKIGQVLCENIDGDGTTLLAAMNVD